MILFQGRVYDTMLQGELLGQLEARINDTRQGRGLEQEKVIRGLVQLGQELREELEKLRGERRPEKPETRGYRPGWDI